MPAPLAVTMGEPAGIGGEIVLKAWVGKRPATPFFVIDSPARLKAIAARFNIACPVTAIAAPAEAASAFAAGLPVLSLPGADDAELGRPDARTAKTVIASIDRAVALVREGKAAGMVTNPIQKAVLQGAGFTYPGHTEYLGHLANAVPVMMLAVPGLRVVPVTVHLPLAQVAKALTTEAIVEHGRITATALRRDFGIARPRIAVAALNPHAGEAGVMGDEESRVIGPAIAALKANGLDIAGPAPADTLFHPAARTQFDAALCMYHDQALIPLKTIDFAGGVNVTLGLPFVRTSPDHGTALDIATRGVADPSSLIAAINLAADMSARRAGARA
jgi:4-hydroxythreonine-4-phosphate dehydrogenase